MTDLAITAKRLGCILLAVYCPRCLWYLHRQHFHPPFNQFGGALWNDMERMQLALVGQYLENEGRLPDEFSPFCDVQSRVEFPRHWSKFGYRHKSGVFLYGVPDDMLRFSDDSLCVIDDKSAHNKGAEDPFLPEYKIQVVGYANIAEIGLKLGTFSKAGIWYWDVQHDEVIADPLKYVRKGRLCPPFTVKPVEVEIDYALLDPLLKEFKKVATASSPPDGLEGCVDCKKLKALFAIEDSSVIADQQRYREQPYFQDAGARHYYRRSHDWYSALAEIQEGNDDLDFSDEGMVSAWFLP